MKVDMPLNTETITMFYIQNIFSKKKKKKKIISKIWIPKNRKKKSFLVLNTNISQLAKLNN